MKVNNKDVVKNKANVITNKMETETKALVLKGIGYPFNFSLMENNEVEVTDKLLFEQYAREQWEGTVVNEGMFLFDQKILPDFAFRVVTAYPENSIVSENTSIVLIDDKEDNIISKQVKSEYFLEDVVGQTNAKNKTKVIMKYLEDPIKFGSWAPKNILFYGLPGTGKTMLAKALSNELNIPLYLIKATSLIGDHVGDGAYKIHELFELAKKKAPSIIFIDEMDAIALDRSYQSLRGDVSEIVNALLTEMDGLGLNEGVITIGATNNINTLDFAVRSRFEEEIEFKLPTTEDRREIINKNLETYPLKMEVSVDELVKLSKNMSGRDIREKLLKTSLHNAISSDRDSVTLNDVKYALNLINKNRVNIKGMFV